VQTPVFANHKARASKLVPVKIIRAVGIGLFMMASWPSCWGQDGTTIGVSLCDLYQRPEQYAGKMIRVRGGSVSSLDIEDSLHDSQPEQCPAYMHIIVVFPDQVKPTPAFTLVRDNSYEKLHKALHYHGPIHIDATYEGRFDAAFVWHDRKRIRLSQDSEKGYGKKHNCDGRIVLRRVSDVWADPLLRK